MKNYYKGIILAIISAIGYSIMPILAVYVYKYDISTFTLLFIRFFISSIILFIYVRFKYKNSVIRKKDMLIFFLLGGVLYTSQAVLHFSSVKYVSPSLSILLLFPILYLFVYYHQLLIMKNLIKRIGFQLLYLF